MRRILFDSCSEPRLIHKLLSEQDEKFNSDILIDNHKLLN